MKAVSNLQDLFLNDARKNKIPVTIFLTNGFQIKGMVHGFDNFIIIVDSKDSQLMIYKHAISSISPLTTITFNFEEE